MDIETILKELRDGHVVKVPTDTVYGYICDVSNIDAIHAIYDLKKRDIKKPLSIFVSKLEDIDSIIDSGIDSLSDNIKKILDRYWPGALTVIFKKKKDVYSYLNEGIDTIAIRVPDDKNLLTILRELNKPLCQTSANISGEKDVSSRMIDGKKAKASTIIDVTSGDIKIVRQGDINIDTV